MNNDKILFKSSVAILDYFSSFFIIVIVIISVINYSFKLPINEWESLLFLYFCSGLLILNGMNKIKIFYLFNDKLMINRPLLFFYRKKVFMLKDVRKIIFRDVKGRYGGMHIIIKYKIINYNYRINIDLEDIKKFDLLLKELNINSILDNVDD